MRTTEQRGVRQPARARASQRAGAERSSVLVTCEHAVNRIPERYRSLFVGREALLRSHRGYDRGAMAIAKSLSRQLEAPLFSATVSRLLIDLNRSLHHRQLFSPITGKLRPAMRQQIIDRYYQPYRQTVDAWIARAVVRGRKVIHISSHSFAPRLNGKLRHADVGLLYDPSRRGEDMLCARWQRLLGVCAPQLVVRRNYPYRGTSDGLTRYLRARYSPDNYVGIELEINQKHCRCSETYWRTLTDVLVESLRGALASRTGR